MPYPKNKSENYQAVGGMNTKASQYITGEGEFLNLQNVDFRVVGALCSSPGSTNYSTVGSTSLVTGIQDISKSLPSGNTVISGVSLAMNAVTTTILATDAYHVCDITGTTFVSVFNYLQPGNVARTSFSYLNLQFGANSRDFWSYPGGTFASACWQYGMGKPTIDSFTNFGSTGGDGVNNGLSGGVVTWFAGVRKDGYIGPAIAVPLGFVGASVLGNTTYVFNGNSCILFKHRPGLNYNVGTGLSSGSFGLSGIQMWVSVNGARPVGLTYLLAATTGLVGFTLVYNYSAAAGGFTRTDILPQDFQGSFLYGAGSTQGYNGATFPSPVEAPQVTESFANQLFLATRSRIYYSDIGTPEQISYSNFFDVGLEWPDDISLMKTAFTQLVIAKPEAVFSLSGTGPSTFVLTTVSAEYGCLSQRAACVWNQQFWFLDKKGIMEFNGANVEPVSNKMEEVFNRMNVSAAQTEAAMVHVKERNEVWTAIPVDGSLTNNLIVIYDYVAKSWTTRTCPDGVLTAMTSVSRGPQKEVIFYGTSNGMIGTFGSSFIGDNGVAFTSVIKSRFIAPLGDSTTNMFRRLFLDAKVPPGACFGFQINLYADHSATYAYSTTMTLTSYQNRIDFGVAAKSLAVEFVYSGSSFLQLNGFTIESRFQRAV